MSTYTTLIFIAVVLFPFVQSARVLFVVTAPIPRHQVIHQFIWEAVAENGHNVTVITSLPLRDFGFSNVTEIDVGSLYEKFFYKLKASINLNATKPSIIEAAEKHWKKNKVYSAYAERIFSHANVQKLIKDGATFDVCVIESNLPAVAAFSAKFGCVLIVTSSSGWPKGYLSKLGGAYYVPPKSKGLGVFETLKYKLYSLYNELAYRFAVIPREDKIVKKYFGGEMPYLGNIQSNASLLIVNVDPISEPLIPTPPNVVSIRVNPKRPKGYMHLGLMTFTNISSEGVVGIDMDPYFKSTKLPESIRNTLRDAFEGMPYFFVWHWEQKHLSGHPINVYITDWIPKYDFLTHEYTKLLITSGDLESIDAAVSSHIPIIGIPMCYEHAENLEKYLSYGIGKTLSFSNLTIESLNETINEVVNNPIYKENAIKLDKLLRGTQPDGVATAVWWIEHVIRNNGTAAIKEFSVDISWYDFYLVDVIGLLLSCLAIVLYIFIKFAVIVYSSFKFLFVKKQKSGIKKKNN